MDILDDDAARHVTKTSVNHYANWFFWLAILSVINSLIVYYYQTPNTPIAFGLTQWLDGTAGGFNNVGSGVPMSGQWLILNIVIAGVFAMFGLLARRGHDVAYVIGMFLYIVDALLVLGLKDFFGFGFHIFALFFLFKGLLASRHIRENAVSI